MTIKKGQIFIFKLKVSAICECADEFQNKIFQFKAYEMKNKTIHLFLKKIKILFIWHFSVVEPSIFFFFFFHYSKLNSFYKEPYQMSIQKIEYRTRYCKPFKLSIFAVLVWIETVYYHIYSVSYELSLFNSFIEEFFLAEMLLC